MDSEYWRGRVTRRQLMRSSAVGGIGLAAAALVGCSGDDEGGSGNGATATTAPSGGGAASGDPQRGGIYRVAEVDAPDHHDMLTTTSISTYRTGRWTHSKLMQWKPGDGEFAAGEMEGDLVESWEQPDELTYNLKLRQGVKWDEREPLNGRELTTEDVVLSWEKWAELGQRRTALSHAASEAGPIESLTALDDRTIQIKLAFPDSVTLQALNWQNNFWITPAESMNGGYDPERESRGTGPFILTDDRPGVSLTYERNPNWHGLEGGAHFDGVEVTIIPEPAQWEAQFRAGNVHEGVGNPSNVPIVAAEMEASKIVKKAPSGYGGTVSLNWLPDSPFHDVRVRRALSMAMDRNVIVDIYSNPSDFEALGVELNKFWWTPLSPAYGAAWLDPQGSDFGPAAEFLKHNVPEAMKLLAAAGFDSGNPVEFDIIEHPRRVEADGRAEVLQAMYAEAGMNAHVTPADYTSEWQAYLSGSGGYAEWKTGRHAVLLKPNPPDADPLFWLTRFFVSSEEEPGIAGREFPELGEMILGARRIEGFEDRVSAVHDIQRFMVEHMVAVPYDAGTESRFFAS